MQSNKFKGVFIYFIVIFLLIFGLVAVLNMATGTGQTVKPYSEVISEFDELNVQEFELDLGSGALTYTLKGSTEKLKYSVPNVSIFISDINSGYNAEGKMATYRVRYNEANPSAPLCAPCAAS